MPTYKLRYFHSRRDRFSNYTRPIRAHDSNRHIAPTSWERVARWYDGMVGDSGNFAHQKAGIKNVLKLLSIQKGERILDIGCGQGVLAPHVQRVGGTYVGVDTSKTLIEQAKTRHKNNGEFFVADATSLSSHREVSEKAPFDACVFLLSIQDISKADRAIREAVTLLKLEGKIVIFMTHPAFRIPRQSGWGVDNRRKLVFRRIDSYLSPLDVPMRVHYRTQRTLTRSFHRPLHYYINALSSAGIAITRMEEIPDEKSIQKEANRAVRRAHSEIPLFLSLFGVKNK